LVNKLDSLISGNQQDKVFKFDFHNCEVHDSFAVCVQFWNIRLPGGKNEEANFFHYLR